MQAALVARAFAISADYKVRVGCGALDIAGTRRTSACRRSDCTKQDERDGQNDQIRPDLHALTNEQLQEIFKIGRDQADGHQLIEGGSEEHPPVLYIWFVTIAAGFGAVIGAVKAVPFVRRQLRTLAVPVQMEDQS